MAQRISTKEKVITASIKKIERRLKKITELTSARPLSRVCEIRTEAQAIFEKHKGDHATISELIEPLGKEEKRMLALAKRQIGNTGKLITEEVDLQMELADLNTELYWLKKREEKQHGVG